MSQGIDLVGVNTPTPQNGNAVLNTALGLITQYSGPLEGYFMKEYGEPSSEVTFSNVVYDNEGEDCSPRELNESQNRNQVINLQTLIDRLKESEWSDFTILSSSYIIDEEYTKPCMNSCVINFNTLESVIEISRKCVGLTEFKVKTSRLNSDEEYINSLKKLHNFIQEAREDIVRKNKFIYILDKQGYPNKLKFNYKEEIVLEEQFNDNFLGVNDRISNWIVDEEKNGLIILHGLKGTGKSTYIKYLINEFYKDKDFVFVTRDGINALLANGLIHFIHSLQNKVVIFEDCEQVLAERTDKNSDSFVPLLLNVTDGLISNVCKCKFILTFNCPIHQIDNALTRKGRCFARHEFEKLDRNKAIHLLKKIGKTFDEEDIPSDGMAINDIFFYEEVQHENKKKRVGFTN